MRTQLILIFLGISLLSACAISQEPIEVETIVLGTPEVTGVAFTTPLAVSAITNVPTRLKVSPTPTTYTVQPGDTLFSIAVAFGLTVEEIAQANGITNPDQIYSGQVLIIPVAANATNQPPNPTATSTRRSTSTPRPSTTRTRTRTPTRTITNTPVATRLPSPTTSLFQEIELANDFTLYSGPSEEQGISAVLERGKRIVFRLERSKQDPTTGRIYIEIRAIINSSDRQDLTIRRGAPLYWPAGRENRIGVTSSGGAAVPAKIKEVQWDGGGLLTIIVEGWVMPNEFPG